MCPHCCTLASLPTSGCRLLFAASTTSASKELHVLEEKVSPAWIGSATLCPTVNIARVKTHAEEAEGEHGKEQHLVCYVISLFSMRLCVLCFVLVCEALGLCSIPSPQMDDGPLVAATCSFTHRICFNIKIWNKKGSSTHLLLSLGVFRFFNIRLPHPGDPSGVVPECIPAASTGSPSLSKATEWLSLRLQWWNVWLPSSQLRLLQAVPELYRLSVPGTPSSPL